jgi:DNA (cytosine-5)-methyltransferase 1
MRSLEIFSGAGGLAKGLELAGFEHVSLIEFNKHACASLRENFKANVFQGDIAEYDLTQLSNIDIVAGGPPCQPFSLGGKHQAYSDKRDMFTYAIKTIEVLEPKAFFFENVKGLLRQSFSEYFQYIVLRLTFPHEIIKANEIWQHHLQRLVKINKKMYMGLKYDVSYKLVNAADYGVPQKRERVLIIGIKSNLNIVWNYPSSLYSEDRLNWDKYVTGDYWLKHNISIKKDTSLKNILEKKYGIFSPETLSWKTVRDTLKDIPCPNEDHSINDHILRTGAKIYIGHTGSDIDQPAKTIKAGTHGVPGGENMIRYEDGSVRYFTVYEAKLMQTFPKDFIVKGSWGEALRQIGNAVPVALSQLIGKQLLETITLS